LVLTIIVNGTIDLINYAEALIDVSRQEMPPGTAAAARDIRRHRRAKVFSQIRASPK
jgi:hypothetical protein